MKHIVDWQIELINRLNDMTNAMHLVIFSIINRIEGLESELETKYHENEKETKRKSPKTKKSNPNGRKEKANQRRPGSMEAGSLGTDENTDKTTRTRG